MKIPNTEWSSATTSVKESVSSLILQVTNALNPQPLDGDEEPYIVENDKIVSITRFQVRIVFAFLIFYLNIYFIYNFMIHT